jgi:hypothetical protein
LRNVNDADDGRPTVRSDFDGPSDDYGKRLTSGTEVDLAFRYQTAVDDEDATGVFSITDRVTGEFILEINADADTIRRLVDAVRRYDETTNGNEGSFSVQVVDDEGVRFEADKRTLLVYDDEGSLRRKRSLIPSGVEL